jgi:hypothetical protein
MSIVERLWCRLNREEVCQSLHLQYLALLTDLVAWVVNGTPSPSSRYPTMAYGALAPAGRIGLPRSPGVVIESRGRGQWDEAAPALLMASTPQEQPVYARRNFL